MTPTATPTSPRVAERRARTRARILAAAWDLAADQGLAELSLRDLAARVGMRAPSLYGYFPSKDAIYDAMYAAGWEALEEELTTFVATQDERRPAHARLAETTRWALRSIASDWPRYQLLFTRIVAGWSPSPEAYEAATSYYARMVDHLASVGVRHPADVDLYTAITSGLLAQQFANDPEGDRYLRLADTAIEMFTAHLGRGPGPEERT